MTDILKETAQEAAGAARAATLPTRLIIGAVAALCAALLVIFVLGRLGFHFDPFNLTKKRAEAAEQRADNAIADAGARSAEAAGERATTQRVEITVRQAKAAQDATATLTEAARTAPDANEPIDPDRLRRIRSNDDSLCNLSRLAGCPAKAANAGDGH